MSVADEANQLRAIAESLTSDCLGQVDAAETVIQQKMAQVHVILQDTASDNEAMGLFNQNKELTQQVIAHLAMMRESLTNIADRIMAAGA